MKFLFYLFCQFRSIQIKCFCWHIWKRQCSVGVRTWRREKGGKVNGCLLRGFVLVAMLMFAYVLKLNGRCEVPGQPPVY